MAYQILEEVKIIEFYIRLVAFAFPRAYSFAFGRLRSTMGYFFFHALIFWPGKNVFP